MLSSAIGMMKWTKKGLIYCPDGSMPWAKHYAFPPTPVLLSEDRLRIFLCFCDQFTVGRAGYVDVDPNDPSKVLTVSKKPILDKGAPGRFDENGLLPTCVLPVDGRLYMYYVGYQLGQQVRYFQFQGLAISDNGGESFERLQEVPILERSHGEAVNRTSAFVLQEAGRFRMWYVGGSEWTEVNGKSLPIYDMRYLESEDGIKWPANGQVCLSFKSDDEHALGRPWVYKEDGIYKMFFSSRTRAKNYRLGYAESIDGIKWERKDHLAGIDVSESGWDSQMVAYASIFQFKKNTYMFYNGNDCGRTGFGFAVLER